MNIWQALVVRLRDHRPDVAYEATEGVRRLEEHVNQSRVPVQVPVIPGRVGS